MKNRLKNNLNSIGFTELLYKYNLKKKNIAGIELYGNQFFKQTKLVQDSLIGTAETLNAILYDKQVSGICKEFIAKNRLLRVSNNNNNNHKTNLILWISLTAICLIFVILYIEKSRREKRNRVILTQQKLLEENKSLLLQQEVKRKQDKITSLALNLNLKKETEKAFLEKIKEIKRHRNVDTESILKELQLSVTNLVQIGLKSNAITSESEDENIKFVKQLKAKHPLLTEQELNLCVFFRLNLNSKEIANLRLAGCFIPTVRRRILLSLILQEHEHSHCAKVLEAFQAD